MSAAPWSRAQGSRQETKARREGHQAALLEDLKERPWATHSQRAEFLLAMLGVRVSEATLCRAVGRLRRSRKKDPKGQSRTRRVLEDSMAHAEVCRVDAGQLVFSRMRWEPTPPSGSSLRLRAHRPESVLRDTYKPRAKNTTLCLRAFTKKGWGLLWPWKERPQPECLKRMWSAYWLLPCARVKLW
jgi:hypothetical protein